MSDNSNSYSLDDLPSEVSFLPMSDPEDVLEHAERDYSLENEHVYVSEDREHVVLADIYSKGQTIDRLTDAINGGAETFNLVGLCVARKGEYSAGDVVEPEEVHGVDAYSQSTEPSYVTSPEEFPVRDVIDGRTKHASVPAVHYDGSDYMNENDIQTGDMETAAAVMLSEGDDRTDLRDERAEDLSVRAALSVFDTFDDGMSQEEVWQDSEISREEAYEQATSGAAEVLDRLAAR